MANGIYRTSQQDERQRIARQAAEWLIVMRGEPSGEERAAFAAWIAGSPAHLEEFLLARMLDQELGVADALAGFDLDTLIEAARAPAEGNVVAFARAEPVRARAPRRRRWRYAAGVAALVLLGLFLWRILPIGAPPGVEYATAIGERQTLTLADGSIVTLSPRSRIEVALSDTGREVSLLYGEADFAVAHDAARPFRVHAGASRIQAVGTRFSVNRLPSGTLVSVAQGRVKVSKESLLPLGAEEWLASLGARDGDASRASVRAPISLSAGESARISTSGRALMRAGAESVAIANVPAPETSARTPRLVFHDDTLADIIEEFNRYNARQIEIEGAAAAAQRYGGVFDATDPNSFLQFIACCSSLEVARIGDRTLIRPRLN